MGEPIDQPAGQAQCVEHGSGRAGVGTVVEHALEEIDDFRETLRGWRQSRACDTCRTQRGAIPDQAMQRGRLRLDAVQREEGFALSVVESCRPSGMLDAAKGAVVLRSELQSDVP
jgi:hypothetical protein